MNTLLSGVVMDIQTETEQGNLKSPTPPLKDSREQREFETMQIASIKEGIAQAERGEFVPHEEMEAFFANWEK